jgi:polyisoprenyl-teichoic acid--peptidoglycan teichoic acid transferase
MGIAETTISQETPPARRKLPRWLIYLLALIYLLLGLISGQWAMHNVIAFVSDLRDTTLAEIAAVIPWFSNEPDSIEIVGKERITLMLLGIDSRPDQTDPGRADAIMLLTTDPFNHKASVLSIPRDLWVTIPGYGEGRINTALRLGEMSGNADGGTQLMEETLKKTLGLPVDYYAVVNFKGFEDFIDEIGGIEIDVPAAIQDDTYPTEDYGTMSITIPAGKQLMNGERALQYIRTRHGSDDTIRMKRQQQVVVAIYNKLQSVNVAAKAPKFMRLLNDNFKTNMQLQELITLGRLALKISPDKTSFFTFDDSSFYRVNMEGSDVLVPDPPATEKLVQQFLSMPKPNATDSAPGAGPIKVIIVNGSKIDGAEIKAAEMAKLAGYNILGTRVGDDRNHPHTIIFSHEARMDALPALAQMFKVSMENALKVPHVGQEEDFTILLGDDFAQR